MDRLSNRNNYYGRDVGAREKEYEEAGAGAALAERPGRA